MRTIYILEVPLHQAADCLAAPDPTPEPVSGLPLINVTNVAPRSINQAAGSIAKLSKRAPKFPFSVSLQIMIAISISLR